MSEPVTARILAGELSKTYGGRPLVAPPCSRKCVAGPASCSSPCSAAGGPALTRFEKAVTYDLAKFALMELSPSLPNNMPRIPCEKDGAQAKPTRGAKLFLSVLGT